MMSGWRWVTPVAFLAMGACFATRNDVRILQEDLAIARASSARADSARAAQLAALERSLGQVGDSVRMVNDRLGRTQAWQANTRDDLRAIQEQLLNILELTGASQRNLQNLRASMEERNQQQTSAAPGDSASRTPGGPGPNQLFTLSRDQLSRGSAGAARSGFEELLKQYPTSDLAPEAQYWIGESYAKEADAGAADSVYQMVVARYPNAPRAATAMYKHGLYLQTVKRTNEARDAFRRVISAYPKSDEAQLATERLREIGGK
jgi:tol-pal system protein YbgF